MVSEGLCRVSEGLYSGGVMLWCLRGNVVVSEGLCCGVSGLCCGVRGVMLWCLRGYVVVSEGLCCGV